jgi:hypothetical protein
MSHKKNKSSLRHQNQGRQQRSLDYFMANFKERCENPKCQHLLEAHAYRGRSKTRSEAVYASCHNPTCHRYRLEICFIEKFIT